MGATTLELTWSMTSLNAPPMSLCSQLALLTLIHNNYVISKSWSSFESKTKIRRLSSPWLCPSFNYSLWGLAHFWCQPQVPNQSTAVWGFVFFGGWVGACPLVQVVSPYLNSAISKILFSCREDSSVVITWTKCVLCVTARQLAEQTMTKAATWILFYLWNLEIFFCL